MSSVKSELNRRLVWLRPTFSALGILRAAFAKIGARTFEFILFSAAFLVAAYFSVSVVLPNAVPVHHDDYTNYASGAGPITAGWVRPLSSIAIQLLAGTSPECLIWFVRLLTILYVLLNWRLFLEFCGNIRFCTLNSVFYAAAVFSTPIVAEYGRYTGMVTHLISGCLGVGAALILVQQVHSPNRVKLFVSVCLLVLSTLAKEDFALLYVVSIIYVLQFRSADRFRIACSGLMGLGLAAVFVLGAKFFAKSGFLGIPDPTSTYYVDASLISIASTIFKYLTGALHPAMLEHGQLVFGIFIFGLISFVVDALVNKRIPIQAYFLFGGLAVVAPYSILPNHVNAYYEILWLPFFISAAIFSAINFLQSLCKKPFEPGVIALPLLLLSALITNFIDYQGRSSIASWYDSVNQSNFITLKILEAQRAQINRTGKVCIIGADMFSPWYMHEGSYLPNVLGLNAHWFILVDDNSLLYQGISMGKEKSAVRVSVIRSHLDFPKGCHIIDLSASAKGAK